MATTNDCTGDALRTRAPSKAYYDGYDRIFGGSKKPVEVAKTDSEKLKELQQAVMLFEPFTPYFNTEETGPFDFYCNECGALNWHRPDCPVTKLREVLKSQGLL